MPWDEIEVDLSSVKHNMEPSGSSGGLGVVVMTRTHRYDVFEGPNQTVSFRLAGTSTNVGTKFVAGTGGFVDRGRAKREGSRGSKARVDKWTGL